MKFFAVFLSIYFSVLAAKPCVDGSAETSSSETELTHHHENHERELDLCAPFCSCACCGIQILHQEFLSFFTEKKALKIFEITPSFYQSRLHSDYFGSIWQPPQLS